MRWARVLVMALALPGATRGGAQELPAAGSRPPAAIAGRVVAGGSPVDAGRVVLRSPGAEYEAAIGLRGEFRLAGVAPGWYEASASSPGWMTHRFTVLAAGDLVLPEIRLSSPAFFQLQIVSPSGEPIVAPRILLRSYQPDGRPVPNGGEPVRVTSAGAGAMSIGPLPRGLTRLTIDADPFARTTLPELRVSEDSQTIDGGTVMLEAGGVLEIAVVDEQGAAVRGHPVQLDADDLSAPEMTSTHRTDARGWVIFDRLRSGLHRVRIPALQPCSVHTPLLERAIEVGPGDSVRREISVAGVPLAISLSSGEAPLAAAEVVLAPLISSGPPSRWLRTRARGIPDPGSTSLTRGAAPCADFADAAGEVRFRHAPPGPARIGIRLGDSLWTRHVNVPEVGGRLNVSVPGGVLAVRVLSADTGLPVPGARVVWASAGSEVEAASDGRGHVLLQAVGDGIGRLRVQAYGHAEAVEENVAVDSPSPVVIKLVREAGPRLSCRVLEAGSGKPVESALVVLSPADPIEDTHVGATDAAGTIHFSNLPEGGLRLAARARGYEPQTMSIPAASREPVVLMLEPVR